jgi:hypothetical protein
MKKLLGIFCGGGWAAPAGAFCRAESDIRMRANVMTRDMAPLTVDGKAACPRKTRDNLVAMISVGGITGGPITGTRPRVCKGSAQDSERRVLR